MKTHIKELTYYALRRNQQSAINTKLNRESAKMKENWNEFNKTK